MYHSGFKTLLSNSYNQSTEFKYLFIRFIFIFHRKLQTEGKIILLFVDKK